MAQRDTEFLLRDGGGTKKKKKVVKLLCVPYGLLYCRTAQVYYNIQIDIYLFFYRFPALFSSRFPRTETNLLRSFSPLYAVISSAFFVFVFVFLFFFES